MQVERRVRPSNSYDGNFQSRPSRLSKNLTKIASKKAFPVFNTYSGRNNNKPRQESQEY